MTNKDIHSLARFFSRIDTKVARKVYKVLGCNIPAYYLEYRPGMLLILATELCQRNKLKSGDFMNLFLLHMNSLEDEIPWHTPSKMF